MSGPLRVILVDDSEDDAMLVLRALRRGGYAVDAVRVDTAAALVEALGRGPCDLILSDQDMPEFDALGALSVRNERGPDIPFLIVSGRIGEEAIVAAMKAGAQDYVLKRDLGRLLPAVERALREMAARVDGRRAVEALRASEARYELAVRGSRDGLWDWDIVKGEVFYAPRFEEMLHLGERALAGGLSAFQERIHPDDVEGVSLALEAHLERREPFSVECRARTARGDYRWFSWRGQALWDELGKPIRMAGSLTDIEERKRSEEELREKLEVIQRQLDIIQEQREAIRLLLTPIIEVWEGVLMTPVLGTLDRQRAASMMDLLLAEVTRTQSHHVIIDLTGVENIDGETADHVIRLVTAVELLGARGLVVGIQPRVASTIVASGFDLSRIKTLAKLRDALVFCMQGRSAGSITSRPSRGARG
jgi:PAS domain S-box-containing protein